MQQRLIRHGLVDSTSERAFAALAAGEARHGDVHVAAGQTRGRGRLGRTWHSPAGEGLYLSLVLLPPPPPPSPAALTMAAGLGVLEGLRSLGLEAARLKWPNDVLARGAKLAGILVESRGLDPARPHAVVGVGVDVEQTAFPPALAAERRVTSLRLEGFPASVDETLTAVLGALGSRLDQVGADPAALARDYLAALGLAGRRVRVVAGSRDVSGELLSLDLDGGIRVRGRSGAPARFPLEHVGTLEECPTEHGAQAGAGPADL